MRRWSGDDRQRLISHGAFSPSSRWDRSACLGRVHVEQDVAWPLKECPRCPPLPYGAGAPADQRIRDGRNRKIRRLLWLNKDPNATRRGPFATLSTEEVSNASSAWVGRLTRNIAQDGTLTSQPLQEGLNQSCVAAGRDPEIPLPTAQRAWIDAEPAAYHLLAEATVAPTGGSRLVSGAYQEGVNSRER